MNHLPPFADASAPPGQPVSDTPTAAVNDIRITPTTIEVEAHGTPAGWLIRNHLVIPLEHVRTVSHDPTSVDQPDTSAAERLAGRRWIGMQMDGPWRSFWNIDGAGRTVVIDTSDGYFDRLVLTVAAPAETVRAIGSAMERGSTEP